MSDKLSSDRNILNGMRTNTSSRREGNLTSNNNNNHSTSSYNSSPLCPSKLSPCSLGGDSHESDKCSDNGKFIKCTTGHFQNIIVAAFVSL